VSTSLTPQDVSEFIGKDVKELEGRTRWEEEQKQRSVRGSISSRILWNVSFYVLGKMSFMLREEEQRWGDDGLNQVFDRLRFCGL